MNKTYLSYLSENGVNILYDTRVLKINTQNGEVKSLIAENRLNLKNINLNLKICLYVVVLLIPFLLQK